MNIIEKTPVSYDLILAEFKDALLAGINGFIKAGEIYVKAIEQDRSYGTRLKEEFADMVPAKAWSQLEALGRKWIHPKLVLGGMSDPQKTTLVKRLPYSEQSKVFDGERYQLLVSGGDYIEVNLLDATTDQAKQIIGDGLIRSLSEQKSWLESKKVQKELKVEELPYQIKGGKITFRKNVSLTRAEMKQLLSQL
tara:strand:+ start:440 stop:1021 length:582 start_codon:yes stop_codon:yes gene_type:complete